MRAYINGRREPTRGDPLTRVADHWFHVTLYQLPQRTDSLVLPAEREALTVARGRRRRTVEPFAVSVGSALNYTRAVFFDLSPDGPPDGPTARRAGKVA